jgi:hypothetical protein
MAMQPNGDTIMMKILSAALLAIGLATSAMAQSSGSGGADTGNSGNTGANTGTSGGNNAGTGTTPNTVDPNATNATQSDGMEDRCKDSAAKDTDNNMPSGTVTSDMQHCNK